MADNTTVEANLERVKKAILDCIKPEHKVYLKDHTILINRKDALKDGWALVKLSMIISGTNWKPNWHLDLYDSENEYKWRIILWQPKE